VTQVKDALKEQLAANLAHKQALDAHKASSQAEADSHLSSAQALRDQVRWWVGGLVLRGSTVLAHVRKLIPGIAQTAEADMHAAHLAQAHGDRAAPCSRTA